MALNFHIFNCINVSNKTVSVIGSGGPMIDYNRKLIEKVKRRDNQLCFFHN